ncbi:ABC transporter substrate-binding protein [Paenibacillus psychroresistens]|uniref:ABC transporter substrate-binding protein n=2 Tax=Paenibacillus psychroresistens TaxID=1778678 RepID=A0A6B8RWM5_9BACL|nr:ABC transporter substrate-binding protein [Paenibacillus psychroresistens]
MVLLVLSACGTKEAKDEASTPPSIAATPAETKAPEATPIATVVPTVLTVKDALGNEVKIPANPQRIIASYLEDPLVALGVKPVAQWSVPNGIQDYLQKDLAGIPNISYDLPFEAVTSFNPDLLIIASNSEVKDGKYEQYNKIAPTYVLGDDINKDWRQALLKIGEILNKSADAQKALDTYEAKAKEAKEKLTQSIGTQSAAAIWLVQKNFYIVSENLSSGSVLYKDMGLAAPDVVKEVSKTGTGNWLPISMEKLADMNVDHLFLINSDKETGSEALKDAVWKNIPAVKNGHVYEFDSKHSWLYGGVIANSQVIDDVLTSLVK